MPEGSAVHRERGSAAQRRRPSGACGGGRGAQEAPRPRVGHKGVTWRGALFASPSPPTIGVGVVRATRVDSHSRGLRSNVGIESHSGSGWQLIRQHVRRRIVMSGMVADVQQPAVWRSVVPATVHTLAVLALPGVSLADRSPRRVPGHCAPLRSRALLSSNHGVSRRQAGAATYGRFSVRPLGPLRV